MTPIAFSMLAARLRGLCAPAARVCAIVTLCAAGVEPASAAQDGRELYRIGAVRVDNGPAIDGVMDEAIWQTAAVIRAFVQQEPAEGTAATEPTEVRILYDRHTLYLGVRALDSEPDRVIATEMRRDSDRLLDEDNFQFILDTFRDSRSAYMFVTSPLGAKLDQQVFEEGEGGRFGTSSNVNRDWDAVWQVAARRTPDGWTAEIAIPLVTLRFPEVEPQDWGINFMRNIRRKNEQAFWAPVPKPYGLTRVSRAGVLSGLSSLSRGRDLRLKPFLAGRGRRELSGGAWGNSTDGDIGLDVKYGVTAGLNLDVTLNTDFAQAEVDDEQVNLTRFPLFFPEKRDFFLENSGQFNVGSTASFDRLADLFYSRRIGLVDTGAAAVPRLAEVPILTGARLTGKAGRNNVAIMDVQTDDAFGQPGENFLVARYSRDVFARSKIGGLVINKQATTGGRFNRTVAMDMTLALHPSLTVNGFLARTATTGVTDGQMGGHLRAGWLNRAWNIYAEYTDLGDNFNPEAGFVPRIGIRTSKLHIERNPRPGRFGIRVLEPMANATFTTDQTGRLVTRRFHYMLGTRFENGAYLVVFYNRNFERLDEPFALRSNLVIAPGDYRFGDWRFWFTSNPSRRIYYSVTYAPQTFFDGDRTDVDARLGARVTSQLSAEARYSRNDVSLPAGAFDVNLGSWRIDYALSPNTSVRAITQYNTSTHQWSASARFRFTYRPGSDLYIAYDDVRRDAPGLPEFRDHRFIVKLTYLVSR